MQVLVKLYCFYSTVGGHPRATREMLDSTKTSKITVTSTLHSLSRSPQGRKNIARYTTNSSTIRPLNLEITTGRESRTCANDRVMSKL